VRATVAIAHERGLELLSLWSTLTRVRWFEKIVQPSTTMELIRQYPLEAANRETNRRSMANGQFMLFRRDGYEAVGGIESVRDFVLEDVEIARRMKHADRRSGVLIADGLLVCRMYDDFRSYRLGWERIFIECARRRSPRLRAFAQRKTLVHLVLPLGSLAGLVWGIVLLAQGMPFFPSPAVLIISGLAASLAYWSSMSVLYGAQGLLLYLPTLPIGNVITIWIMFSAARTLRKGGTLLWGGREYLLVDQGRKPGAIRGAAAPTNVDRTMPSTE
jgi:ABC-type multidrug transport system fused ATPase/permease subunit